MLAALAMLDTLAVLAVLAALAIFCQGCQARLPKNRVGSLQQSPNIQIVTAKAAKAANTDTRMRARGLYLYMQEEEAMEISEEFPLPPLTWYPPYERRYVQEIHMDYLALWRIALVNFYQKSPTGTFREFLQQIRKAYPSETRPDPFEEWMLYGTAMWQLQTHGYLPLDWRPKPFLPPGITKIPWLRLRFQIFKRDNYRCRLCGVSAKDGDHVRLEVDHITPRSAGGTDDEMNLWTLCFPCNRGKGTKEL